MFCTQLLAKVKFESGQLTPEPLYCKSWTCPVCAPRRQRALRWLGRSGHPQSFLTLTVNPARLDTPGARARALRSAWRSLRQNLRRRYPRCTFAFLAVFEKTKLGEPHLHILFRGPYVPQEQISQYMRKKIGAPIVFIEHIDNPGRAAAYVAKYVSKEPRLWTGCKRYWRSMDWQLVPDDPRPKLWTHLWIVKAAYEELLQDLAATGISCCELVRGGRITFGWWTADFRVSQC